MAAKPGTSSKPVWVVHGEEGPLVRKRARACFEAWCGEVGGMDHEVVDGAVGTADEALKSIARLREAMQTLPFFGGEKVIWWQGCTFMGDDRTSASSVVTEALAALGEELAVFRWQGVRLVVSAGKMDKRRVFYKRLESIGQVEEQESLSADMKDWAGRAEGYVEEWLGGRGKRMEPEVLGAFVARVGPNLSLLQSEVEKVGTYVGDREEVTAVDVEQITVKNRQARAFALADAMGDRDVPRMLKALDDELWAVQEDRDRSEIGLLYGLVGKVRAMLLAKELLREKLVSADGDYSRFKTQLTRIPAGRFPEDRRYNPLSINAYVLYRAAGQSRHWSEGELVDGLERLMVCNLEMIGSSSQHPGRALQRALLEVVPRRS